MTIRSMISRRIGFVEMNASFVLAVSYDQKKREESGDLSQLNVGRPARHALYAANATVDFHATTA